jgi:uncharacterized protein (TIGR03086 family)
VEAVPEDRWSSPSPCEDWDARDVLSHVVGNVGWFFTLIGRDAPDGPAVDADPTGAWRAGRDALQAALDDQATAGITYDSPMMGQGTFEQAVDRFGNLDVLIHTWDLARATGGDEHLDDSEVHQAIEACAAMDDMLRSSGACGPKLDPPPGSDEQTRLLAFLGRRA